MARLTIDQWIKHLRGIATPAASVDARLPLGPLEGPFRAAVQGQTPVVHDSSTGRPSPETLLWQAIVDDSIDVDTVIEPPSGGSLLRQGLFRTIEVWTEAELCALHALENLSRTRDRADWGARVAQVRGWHVDHTQPDNATNRPWALHVFVLGGTPECAHYAETLLHNALAFDGTPEPLSAWILLDAANELEKA